MHMTLTVLYVSTAERFLTHKGFARGQGALSLTHSLEELVTCCLFSRQGAGEKKETIMAPPCPSLALPQLHVWSLDLVEASTADEIFEMLVQTRVHHKFCLVRRSRTLAVLVAKVEVTLDNLSGAARRPFRAGDPPLDERIAQLADGVRPSSSLFITLKPRVE